MRCVFAARVLSYEKVLGADHASTIGTVHNLGNLYVALSRPKHAEAMQKRALDASTNLTVQKMKLCSNPTPVTIQSLVIISTAGRASSRPFRARIGLHKKDPPRGHDPGGRT
jgi:hypothetical protein